MGPQRPDTLVNLLRECAVTDGGILFEPRDEAGLAYRTRDSLCNRAASAVLDYAGHEMTGLEPVDDDRNIHNDVTVTRRSGSSARASQDSGTLSTAAPPDGVGRYTEQTQVNTSTDAALPDHASWRLHLGTVDEPRYPAIQLNLANPEVAGDQALSEAILDLDAGHRLAIVNLPAWLPPGDVSAGVQGLSETLSTFTHEITVNGTPESPWHVGVYDEGGSRYSANNARLSAAADATQASISVVSADADTSVWSHADGDFDILVGGERMTVTAVGAGPPQALTVTRSVNGVVKPQAAGTAVELFNPVYYAL
jgi:hypothetical protein